MPPAHVGLAKRLGAIVRKRRMELRWSQAQLAERMETSVEFAGMVERGARMPSLATLLALADALGMTTDALLGREPYARREDVFLKIAETVPEQHRPVVGKMLSAIGEPEPMRALATRTGAKPRSTS